MSLQRTYEIIAKYVGQENGIKIHLEPDAQPRTRTDTKEIWLPSNVKEENIIPAIAVTFHEANHIKHTTYDKSLVCPDPDLHYIWNALEDVRIDRIGSTMLMNARKFYYELYKSVAISRPPLEVRRTLPFEARVMSELITECLGFCELNTSDPEVRDFIIGHDLITKSMQIVNDLDCQAYERARKGIEEIGNLFKRRTQNQEEKQNTGAKDDDKQPSMKQIEDAMTGLGYDKKDIFEPDPSANTGCSSLGPAALKEQTEKQFEELLRVRQTRIKSNDQGNINSDNLTAFITGDVDELFKTDEIEKPKKSKVLFLLDMSGSMRELLIDRQRKIDVVAKITKSITNILDRVNETVGVDVNYEVNGFNSFYYPFTKDNWQKSLRPAGGTALLDSFEKAHNKLASDIEAEGSKILIVATDGYVRSSDLEKMREIVMRSNQDVRTMIVGVGADPTNKKIQEIIHDHNILAEDAADSILLDSITDCLR